MLVKVRFFVAFVAKRELSIEWATCLLLYYYIRLQRVKWFVFRYIHELRRVRRVFKMAGRVKHLPHAKQQQQYI